LVKRSGDISQKAGHFIATANDSSFVEAIKKIMLDDMEDG